METIPVKISKKVHDEALEFKEKLNKDKFDFMDKGSYMSYLIKKGIERINLEGD